MNTKVFKFKSVTEFKSVIDKKLSWFMKRSHLGCCSCPDHEGYRDCEAVDNKNHFCFFCYIRREKELKRRY